MFQNPELCEEFPQLWNFTTGSVPFVQPTLIYVFNRSSHQKYDPTHPYISIYHIYRPHSHFSSTFPGIISEICQKFQQKLFFSFDGFEMRR